MPSQTQAAPQRQQRLLVYTSGDNSASPSEPGAGLMSSNPNDVPMARAGAFLATTVLRLATFRAFLAALAGLAGKGKRKD